MEGSPYPTMQIALSNFIKEMESDKIADQLPKDLNVIGIKK